MNSKLQVIQDKIPPEQNIPSNPQASSSDQPPAWLKEGLRFQCTGCGKCCTGSPGYVWVLQNEINEIAEFLKIPVPLFMRKYVRQKHGRFSLIEKPSENYDCIFLSGKQCTIYPVRPTQCRTFPWWPHQLKSQESWEEAAKTCEGIQEEAPLVPYSEIKQQLDIYSAS